jgi:hypothetical protein
VGISVELDLGHEFTVEAPIKAAHDLASDVSRSVSHCPGWSSRPTWVAKAQWRYKPVG